MQTDATTTRLPVTGSTAKANSHKGLALGAMLASAVVLVPVAAIVWLAVTGGGSDWPHLILSLIHI